MKKITYILILLLSFQLFVSPVSAQTDTPSDDEKNPWTAAGFSLLLPGSGQMYANESIWPEALITVGIAAAVGLFIFFNQQRADSISERTINGQTRQAPDAHWDALTLAFQIAVPSLWLWNAGDAYRQAEKHNEKVIKDLDSEPNAYIMKENLVSVTLWQF